MNSVCIKSGVRQGGVISTWYYNFYVHELSGRLRESDFGCFMASIIYRYIFFVGDILLISALILHLQSMLLVF